MDSWSWLGKTLNNNAHMIGVPGDGGKVFITRSIRRVPQPWDPQLIADLLHWACTVRLCET